MSYINTLASIAKDYGITKSSNLRDEIVSEYANKIESLNTIDESVISRSIELLPVYTINEGLFNKKTIESNIIEEGIINKIREKIQSINAKKEEKEWKNKAKQRDMEALLKEVTPYTRKEFHSKSDFDKFYRNNDFFIECVPGDKDFCQIIANMLGANYDIQTPVEIFVTTGKDMNKVYDLAGNNAYRNNVHHIIVPLHTLKNDKDIVSAKYTIKARYFNDVVDNNEYREYKAGRHKKSAQIQWIIDALEKNESTNMNGYAVDLSSLKYVVESNEDMTLEEAMQEIRDINYIDDTIPMYCVLPEDINEKMSLESFIGLNDVLIKNDITPIAIREYSEYEFITEAILIKNMKEPQLRKELTETERRLKLFKEKKEKFDKLSDNEKKKYCRSTALKNDLIVLGVTAAGVAAGTALGATNAATIAAVGSYNGYSSLLQDGENTYYSPKKYDSFLNKQIHIYEDRIKEINKRLKELEKGNK